MCNWSSFSWVSPFRNRRIKGYLLLPGAYRSLSRLSSALSAKASTICSFMLDQIDLYWFQQTNLKVLIATQTLAPSVALIWFRFYNSFHRWNMVYRNHLGFNLRLSVISNLKTRLSTDIPRMSWYFIWYSMCSFQGTRFVKFLLYEEASALTDWAVIR